MKILQIAYHYPPMGGAGVQRALKFSKYLPLHGITPVVLAGFDPHYVQDGSLLSDVPAGLEVHRVKSSPWLARLAALRRRGVTSGHTTPSPSTPSAPAAGSRAWRDAALRAVRALQVPDDLAAWSRAAARQAGTVLREHAARGEPIGLIYSSSPPASAHALAERLAREFGLPWVADWRDLWTDNPAYDAPAWRRAMDLRTEQRWLAAADGIVTVTPSWQALLAAQRPEGTPVAFIPNGYDEDDFAALPPVTSAGLGDGRFTLIHTGTFYGPRDPAGLLEGLSRYLDGPREGHPALRVRLLGNMGARFGRALHAFSVRHPDVIVCEPYVPHTEALAAMAAADALLLVVGGGRGPAVQGWLPGKIFEYLRSGKPVLSLGDPQGDAAQLIGRYGQGHAVPEDDAAGIARALSQILERRAMATSSPSASPAVFERRELARQLAVYLRTCRDRHRVALQP
jgi:glycosyltransferase involved in cell wall biosynthesis